MNEDDIFNRGDAPVFDLISSFMGNTSRLPTQVTPEARTNINDATEERENSMIDHPLKPVHKIIIFSKDRPWQLQQLLISMQLNIVPPNKLLHIFIICRVVESFKSGYDKVQQMFSDVCNSKQLKITWLYECDGQGNTGESFPHLLENALHYPATGVESENTRRKNLVLFLTDDCVLLESLHEIINAAESVLNCDKFESRVLALITRLHPGITFCQTKNEPSPPPRSHFTYVNSETKLKVFVYPQRHGSIEYAYPFDLSGGIYHQDTCIGLLDELKRFHRSPDHGDSRMLAYSHPNILEIQGNNAIQRIKYQCKGKSEEHLLTRSIQRKDLLSIPSQPFLVILAINRVQDIFKAPIATGLDNSNDKVAYTPELLAKYLESDKRLDLDKYKSRTFNASHIGEVFLGNSSKHDPLKRDEVHFTLSILIPVHTGPPSAANLAMKSILHQTIDGACILPIQIVLVDDRCKDGSIDEMLETAKKFAQKYHQALEIKDQRYLAAKTCYNGSEIVVEVVTSPSPGVASALNFGLKICESDFVARMDSDDVSCPNRLITQIRHMTNNPTVHALGTSCVVFTDPSSVDDKRSLVSLPYSQNSNIYKTQHRLIRSSVEPTDPGFVAWSMLFSCVIVHPSVMFQKSQIIKMGGYQQTSDITCTEDYDLWLRLVENNPRSVCSLPILGVFHRKHINRCSNDMKVESQRKESAQLSSVAMARYCNETASTSLKVVEALKFPRDADNLLYLNEAASLLCALEVGFVAKNGPLLTNNEVELIALDCNNRLGELATLSVEKYGHEGTKGKAWELWCDRCPDLKMERLALLVHATNS